MLGHRVKLYNTDKAVYTSNSIIQSRAKYLKYTVMSQLKRCIEYKISYLEKDDPWPWEGVRLHYCTSTEVHFIIAKQQLKHILNSYSSNHHSTEYWSSQRLYSSHKQHTVLIYSVLSTVLLDQVNLRNASIGYKKLPLMEDGPSHIDIREE